MVEAQKPSAESAAPAPEQHQPVTTTKASETATAAASAETSATKEKSTPTTKQSKAAASKSAGADVTNKYNKLKKRYRHLREEYTRILESWEASARSIKTLLEERKFLKKKLETFFKSQHFIDDQVFATANNPASKSVNSNAAEVAINNHVKTLTPAQVSKPQAQAQTHMSSILHMNPNGAQSMVRREVINQQGAHKVVGGKTVTPQGTQFAQVTAVNGGQPSNLQQLNQQLGAKVQSQMRQATPQQQSSYGQQQQPGAVTQQYSTLTMQQQLNNRQAMMQQKPSNGYGQPQPQAQQQVNYGQYHQQQQASAQQQNGVHQQNGYGGAAGNGYAQQMAVNGTTQQQKRSVTMEIV